MLRKRPPREPLLVSLVAKIVPRLPAWFLPALAAVAVIGVLLIGWRLVS